MATGHHRSQGRWPGRRAASDRGGVEPPSPRWTPRTASPTSGSTLLLHVGGGRRWLRMLLGCFGVFFSLFLPPLLNHWVSFGLGWGGDTQDSPRAACSLLCLSFPTGAKLPQLPGSASWPLRNTSSWAGPGLGGACGASGGALSPSVVAWSQACVYQGRPQSRVGSPHGERGGSGARDEGRTWLFSHSPRLLPAPTHGPIVLPPSWGA